VNMHDKLVAPPLDAVLDYIWGFPAGEADYVTVVVPEQFEKPSLARALIHRSTFSLKRGLVHEPGIAVADVPRIGGTPEEPWTERRHAACVVPISGLNAASVRALLYARSLGFAETTAVFFAFDEGDAQRMQREWRAQSFEFPLEILEAPYRDLGEPLVERVQDVGPVERQPRGGRDDIAVIVMQMEAAS